MLVSANQVFGLNFAAVADICAQIVAACNRGAAVLLVSEDLDKLLELGDRILIMSDGEVMFESPVGTPSAPASVAPWRIMPKRIEG